MYHFHKERKYILKKIFYFDTDWALLDMIKTEIFSLFQEFYSQHQIPSPFFKHLFVTTAQLVSACEDRHIQFEHLDWSIYQVYQISVEFEIIPNWTFCHDIYITYRYPLVIKK